MPRQDTAGTGAAGDGALAGYLVGFRKELARSGYRSARTSAHLKLFADLCRWTERQGIALPELGDGPGGCVPGGPAAPGTRGSDLARLRAPTGGLPDPRRRDHRAGIRCSEGPCPAAPGALPALPGDRTRLTAKTIERYVEVGCRLAAALERGGAVDWQRVRARDVTRFLLGNCPPPRGHHAPGIISPLRSFLRFCHLEGVISLPLDGAVPGAAGRRMSPLPKGIPPGELDRLLASCDRQRAWGRRDYAILSLLSPLGQQRVQHSQRTCRAPEADPVRCHSAQQSQDSERTGPP